MGVIRLLLTAPCRAGTCCSASSWRARSCPCCGLTFLLVYAAFRVDVPWRGWRSVLRAVLLAGFMLGAVGLLLSVHIRQLVNFAGTMNFVIFRMFFVSSALYRSGKCRSQAGGRALQVGGPRLRLAAWAGGPAPRGTRCQGLDGLPRRVATLPGR
jgi:hypothetical protein